MQRDRWKIGRRVGACCMVLALAALFLQACTDLRVVRREMYAVIVQCTKNEILVEPEEGTVTLNGQDITHAPIRRRNAGGLGHTSNRIYVPAAEAKLFDEHKNSIPFEELRDGDRVKVVYDGAILETYPGQIGNCYEIHRVGRAETSSATEL